MKTGTLPRSAAALFLPLSTAAFCGEAPRSDRELGTQLVRQIWEAMKTSDGKAIDNVMADGFQSVHDYGTNDREAEKALIAKLNMSNYTIENLQITRNGPVIIATYRVSVEETIRGERLTKDPASRMSVFEKTESGWQWIAHANLHPVKAEKP